MLKIPLASTRIFTRGFQSSLVAPSIITNFLGTFTSNGSEADRPTYFQRPETNYPGHVPLHPVEHAMAFLGTSLMCYLHPERGDMIADFGELSAHPYILKRLRSNMLSNETGRRILREKPNMTSESLNLSYISQLPEGTIGRIYYDWITKEHVSPDTRLPVRFISDPELAYIFLRYRQCHDFYHAVIDMPTNLEAEVAVKAIEWGNMGIPIAGLGTLLEPFNMKPKQRDRLWKILIPWAVDMGYNMKHSYINVYWEEIMEKNINEFREEMGIKMPPINLREIRKRKKTPTNTSTIASNPLV